MTARVAVDAKYKPYDERKLDTDTCARASSMPTRSVEPEVVCRPPCSCTHRRHSRARGVRLRIQSAQTSAAAEILAVGFSIPEALAEVEQSVRGPVTQAIIEAIQQGTGGVRTVAA